MKANILRLCNRPTLYHVICVFLCRTGKERLAMLSMAFSLWVMSSTATSFSSQTTVGMPETLCATTITPTSAPKTKTMTNVWMTVLLFAKVNYQSNSCCHLHELLQGDICLLSTICLTCFFSSNPYRWLLVQLLHWLKLEWCLLPLRQASEELRWDHLVWLAWVQLLPQESGDEDPASGISTLSALADHVRECREISLIPVQPKLWLSLEWERNENVACNGLVKFQMNVLCFYHVWL